MQVLVRNLLIPAFVAAGLAGGSASLLARSGSGRAHAQLASPSLTLDQLGRLQRIAGQFAYASGTSVETLRRSVADATQTLEARAARTVRGQVEEMLLPARRLRFALENVSATGTRVQLQEGRATISTPLNGVLEKPLASRSDARLSQQLQGSALVQIIESRGLRQERRFSLNDSGTSLTLNVRVTGSLLAAPVQVQAVYQRL
jgi:hypothetical protein